MTGLSREEKNKKKRKFKSGQYVNPHFHVKTIKTSDKTGNTTYCIEKIKLTDAEEQ